MITMASSFIKMIFARRSLLRSTEPHGLAARQYSSFSLLQKVRSICFPPMISTESVINLFVLTLDSKHAHTKLGWPRMSAAVVESRKTSCTHHILYISDGCRFPYDSLSKFCNTETQVIIACLFTLLWRETLI